MRHVRMLGLCLAAMLALGAYLVSSASALPEWGKCVAQAGGKYSDGNCTVKAKKGTGTHEWLKASQVAKEREAKGKSANIPFSGGNLGSGGILRTGVLVCERPTEVYYEQQTRQHCLEQPEAEVNYAGEEGVNVECEAEKNTGETAGKNGVANVHVIFTGCKALGTAPCNSAGAAEGEVRVNELKGKLGYIDRSAKEVGVMLEPVAKHGAFAEFVCGGVIHTVVGVGNKKEGSFYLTSGCIGSCESATPTEEKHGGYDEIISPVTPVNTMTNAFTQVYKVNAKSENQPTRFEGKHISLLEDHLAVSSAPKPHEGIMWSPAGEEITNVNTPEEEGEIKA